MSKYFEYTNVGLVHLSAHDAIEKIKAHVDDAVGLGWSELYLLPDEDLLSIRGVKPPDKEAIIAAKEKRRKQYERLKKEFEEQ